MEQKICYFCKSKNTEVIKEYGINYLGNEYIQYKNKCKECGAGEIVG